MKFSIRDLFLATLIVALAVGWWVDRRGLRTSMRQLQLKLDVYEHHGPEEGPLPLEDY